MQQRAFTLIEILVAMAIFSLIGLASTGVLSTVIDSNELSEQRFAKLEALQRAMLTIERDLLQATPRAPRLEGRPGESVMVGGKGLFNSDTDGIAFVRSGWQNPQLMLHRSSLQPVIYRLQDEQLQRLYSNYVDNPIGHEPKQKILLEGVTDFKVAFLTDTDEEDNWQENYSNNELPIAVSVTLDTQAFGVIRREFFLGDG